MKIRFISETEFTVKGHGVHTAYLEIANAMKKRSDCDVRVNKLGKVDVTHLHTIGLYSLFFLLFGSGRKVISAHVIPASFVGSLAGTKYWLWMSKIYVRWFYNRADLVLAVSDNTKRQLEELGVKKPIEVFYNYIDTQRYYANLNQQAIAKSELGYQPNDWVVVGAGQVQPRKRVDTFLILANKLPQVKFRWVGGMPFGRLAASHGEMQNLMTSSPDNLLFTGVLPLEQVAKQYWGADVFLLPSEQETFGLVVVEAAASGLPIVLRDIDDYNETFRDYALMCRDDNFAEAITRLRDDEQFYREMTRKSALLAKRFDSSTGAEILIVLYNGLIAK